MEVKDFVKSILKDITEAVEESNDKNYSFDIDYGPETAIHFDLAVTLKKKGQGKVGAEIFSVVGAKAVGSLSQESVNRIKFKVIPSKKFNKGIDGALKAFEQLK